MIFLNSAISAAALVFYLPDVCTHADTEGKQRKARVRNILKSSKNTQYLINKLYLVIIDPVFILYTLYFLEPVIILQNILLNIKRRKSLLLLTFDLCRVARVVAKLCLTFRMLSPKYFFCMIYFSFSISLYGWYVNFLKFNLM